MSQENVVEYKTVTNPSFPVLMYEVEELLSYGWKISQEQCPNANFTLYEVELYRDDESVEEAKKRANSAEVGKRPYNKEARQETLASARAVKAKQKKEGQSDGG